MRMYRETVEAVVTSIADPEQRGRIKVTSRALAAEGVEIPDWVEPRFPYTGKNDAGWFFLPDPDTMVELELVAGSSQYAYDTEAIILHPQYRWRACIYNDTSDVPSEFRSSYGKRMGLKTPKGQVLMFDEAATETVLLGFLKLKLGSESSDENLVLGQIFKTFASSLLDGIVAHTHQTGTGPSSPPINAATFTALKASPITDEAILSDKSFTEK